MHLFWILDTFFPRKWQNRKFDPFSQVLTYFILLCQKYCYHVRLFLYMPKGHPNKIGYEIKKGCFLLAY